MDVDPERKDSLFPVLRLFGGALVRHLVEDDTLALDFAGAEAPVAGPDAGYESWHVSGPMDRPVAIDTPERTAGTRVGGSRRMSRLFAPLRAEVHALPEAPFTLHLIGQGPRATISTTGCTV